jgi:hypothetical protein
MLTKKGHPVPAVGGGRHFEARVSEHRSEKHADVVIIINEEYPIHRHSNRHKPIFCKLPHLTSKSCPAAARGCA